MTVRCGADEFILDVKDVDEKWIYVGQIDYSIGNEPIVVSAKMDGAKLPFDAVLFRPIP